MSMVEYIWKIIGFIFSIILILGIIAITIKVIKFAFDVLLLVKDIIKVILKFIKDTFIESFNSIKKFLHFDKSKKNIESEIKPKEKSVVKSNNNKINDTVIKHEKPFILSDLTSNIKKLDGLKKLSKNIINQSKRLSLLKDIEALETIIKEDNKIIDRISSSNIGLYYFYNYKIKNEETHESVVFRHLIIRGNKVYLLKCNDIDETELIEILNSFGVQYEVIKVENIDYLLKLLKKEHFTDENNRIGIQLSNIEDKSYEDVLQKYKLNAIDFK